MPTKGTEWFKDQRIAATRFPARIREPGRAGHRDPADAGAHIVAEARGLGGAVGGFLGQRDPETSMGFSSEPNLAQFWFQVAALQPCAL